MHGHERFVSYHKRSERGLDNQCWKDSWNAIQFHDGTLAKAPIATVEVQGYAIAAYRAMASLARRVWGDEALAGRALARADMLERAVEQRFWLPERGHHALAIDGEGRAVDSLTSNVGHLLWCGVCSDAKAAAIRDVLMDERLCSGWGIRTLSSSAAGYNPIGYHTGTVWPHDSSLIAAGLARYGFRREANLIATALLEAAVHFGYRLPEVFAGYARRETGFPVEYPTASSPQAWAAATPLLLLSTVLGLQATKQGELRASPDLPSEIASIALSGIRHRGARYDLVADARGVDLRRASA